MKWADDNRTEQMLKNFGVSFSKEDVPLSAIDQKLGLRNQSRYTQYALSDDRVSAMVIAMSDGVAFPKPILEQLAKSRYSAIDGNHRIAATDKLGFDTLSAYVVAADTTSQQRNILLAICNVSHGEAIDTQSKCLHADRLVETNGLRVSEVCRWLCLGEAVYSKWKSIKLLRARLAELGVKQDRLTDSHVVALRRISNDNVLVPLCHLVSQHKITAEMLNAIATSVAKPRTELQQLAVLADSEKSLAASAPTVAPKLKTPIRTKFLRVFHAACSLAESHKTLAHLQITSNDEVAALLADYRKLGRLFK